MQFDINLVDKVTVAAPCPASWEEMQGSEQKRYCDGCKMHVYNLSDMTRRDAERLLQTHEGRLCIRYGRRPDGKVVTDNCPPPLRPVRKLLFKRWAAVASFGLLLFNITCRAAEAMQRRAPAQHAGGAPAGRKLTLRKHHAEAGKGSDTAASSRMPGERTDLDRSPVTGTPTMKIHHDMGEGSSHEGGEASLTNKADAYMKVDRKTSAPKPTTANGSMFTMTGVAVRF